MPFRVLGLDLIDIAGVCYLLAPSSPERPFKKGAEMLRLKDRSALTDLPSPPGGIELPPLHEPQWLEATPSYVPSSGVTIMTATELAEAGSAATPPAPRIDMFGNRVSHITGRFVLGASKDAYRIFPFQSAEVLAEFPVTTAGWADAWTAFLGLEAG